MRKRICYIHVGPHKTGTTSIQSFLRENRSELLKHGYFVPESGNIHGGHHPLVRQLCGKNVPNIHNRAAAKFTEALTQTLCEAVVISSEAFDGLLRRQECASAFFNHLTALNLKPRIVVFPRNQPQLINSRYVEVVRGFRRSEPFEVFVSEEIHHASFRYSDFVALANRFDAELDARPFTRRMITKGVVVDFLQAIEADPSRFEGTEIRHNQTAGPFTVSVARDVSRLIANLDRRLTGGQARRCKRRLTRHLQENGLADIGYCGLSAALARRIENHWQQDNDVFAQHVWQKPWNGVFAEDTGREFTPNDFDVAPPDDSTQRQRNRTAMEVMTFVEGIIADHLASDH
jgi:hypothetical protein